MTDPRSAVVDRIIRFWTALLLPGDPPRFSFSRMFLIGGLVVLAGLLVRR